MGWGSGFNNEGREVGYNIIAQCDHPKCRKIIDRGLAYMCGGDLGLTTAATFGGGGPGCGKYFCMDHLGFEEHSCTHPLPMCEGCGDFAVTEGILCATCLAEEGDAIDDMRR